MIDFIVKYWLEAVFGLVCTALACLYRRLAKKIKGKSAEDAAIKDGLLAILHDRIYSECSRCIKGGEVAVDELRNIEYLYTAYHTLGGNGTGTELYNRVTHLNIKEE